MYRKKRNSVYWTMFTEIESRKDANPMPKSSSSNGTGIRPGKE
jgi:hypothetical protein